MTLFEVCKVVPSNTIIFLGFKSNNIIHWCNLNTLLKRNKKINFDLPVIEIDNGNQCLNVVVEGSY